MSASKPFDVGISSNAINTLGRDWVRIIDAGTINTINGMRPGMECTLQSDGSDAIVSTSAVNLTSNFTLDNAGDVLVVKCRDWSNIDVVSKTSAGS